MNRTRGSRRVVGLRLFAATLVVAAAGCNRQSGHARSDAETTATASGASAFAERLRAAGNEMVALEAQVRSMEPDAAIDLLEPVLRDEDPDLAERAADLLLALESPEADRVIVLDALARTGDGMGRLDSTGGRRIDAMGRRGLLALILLYRDEGAPGEKLPPELGKGCELTMDLLGLVDWPDVRSVILRCLTWEDVDTAKMVGWTLADRDHGAECPRFRAMLRSDKPLERAAAIAGLYACEDARAVPDLRAVLDDKTSLPELSPHRYHIRGPRDQCPPGGPCTTPEEPETMGEYAADVIDYLTERDFHGDAAAIDAWIRTNLPPADNPTWMPRPLGPVAFWEDLRPIKPRDADRGKGEGCERKGILSVDLRGDGRPYAVDWRRCPEQPALESSLLGVPEFLTFVPPGAAEAVLAFSNLVTSSTGSSAEGEAISFFDRVEEVGLRGDSSRQVLAVRMFDGNGCHSDWCIVGAVGDGIGCWSQPDLDERARPRLRPDEDIGMDGWFVKVEGARVRLWTPVFARGDAHCCPSRGSFVAELSAHPTEPRLVLASFERRSAASTAGAP
ncbi:MAG: hypothetical protein HY905_18940 [Deltaproteobacteria bacterium]|nr:hypothetical protein [Deltaproteobacteria bacterium]